MRTRVAIISELNELYREKNRLYGDSFRETLDEFGVVAAIVRMMDKVNRAKTLVKHTDASGEHEVIHVVTDVNMAGESLRDTLLDIANYAIMTLEWMDAHEQDPVERVCIEAQERRGDGKRTEKEGECVTMELKERYPLISYRSLSPNEKSNCCCCDNSAVFVISARIDGVVQEYLLCLDHLEKWVALIEDRWGDIVLQTVRTDRD